MSGRLLSYFSNFFIQSGSLDAVPSCSVVSVLRKRKLVVSCLHSSNRMALLDYYCLPGQEERETPTWVPRGHYIFFHFSPKQMQLIVVSLVSRALCSHLLVGQGPTVPGH